MPNLPILFSETDRVENPSLHFAYNFDIVNFYDIVSDTLPMNQMENIKSLRIDLTERTSNPNLSVSVDRVTSLFSLKNLHLTNTYPSLGTRDKALVIEGFHIENVNTEKILLFLPLTKEVDSGNVFRPLEMAIPEKKAVAIDLNTYIPKNENFSYYAYVDSDGTKFHVVYFEKTDLKYAALPELPANNYTSKDKADVFISNTKAVRRKAVDSSFEDNIYIDCVPVEVSEKPKETYLSIANTNYSSYANNFIDMLVVLSYAILLVLIVYGIYWLYMRFSTKGPTTVPMP